MALRTVDQGEEPFPYDDAEYEEIACNLCGSSDSETVETHDRNLLPCRSVICRRCGLLHLNPRMRADWYQRYYAGEYRRQMAAFRGLRPTRQDHDAVFQRQLRHGAWLADWLRKRSVQQPRRILDIGCGTGGILRALADAFGAEVLGIEPSPDEAAFARQHGVPCQVGLFEDVALTEHGPFDLVLCTQSFNHVLDPRGVAEKVRGCLSADGCFFVECQDFFQICRYWGAVRYAVQIDHVTMFVPSTLRSMLTVAGFEVPPGAMTCDRFASRQALAQQRISGAPIQHMRVLAHPSAGAGQPSSRYEEVRRELDALPNARWHGQLRVGWMRLRVPLAARLRRVSRALGARR